jgi:hypothetical protein
MAIFGNDSIVGSTNTILEADIKWGSKFALSEAGTVSKVTGYFATDQYAAVKVKACIYHDTAGLATAALEDVSVEVSPSVSQAAAWVDFTFSSGVELTAGDYWLVYIVDNEGANFLPYYIADGVHNSNADEYDNGPSDPFGAVDANGTAKICIYATYTAGGPGFTGLTVTRVLNG